MRGTHPRPLIQRASGEQLLLVAIFGGAAVKAGVDRELDRRAREQTRLLSTSRRTGRAA